MWNFNLFQQPLVGGFLIDELAMTTMTHKESGRHHELTGRLH